MNLTDFQNESYLYIYSDIKATFITDFFLAALFVVFGFIYLICTIRQTCEEKGEVEGQFEAQISYIVAVFCKGIGLLITGLFLAIKTPKPGDHDFWDDFSVLPGGVPGYVTAIAYCFIFFSWCSVCFDSLEKDSVNFYSRSKWILMTMIILICVAFVVFFICKLVIDPVLFHKVEATIAILRDLIIFFLFSLYLRRIFKLFEEPCPGWSSPETKLLFICITLIVSLLIRPISIGIYILWIYPPNHHKRSEFATPYLIIYLIEILITEIIPIGAIGITRLTGAMQKTAKSEDVAQFLAIS